MIDLESDVIREAAEKIVNTLKAYRGQRMITTRMVVITPHGSIITRDPSSDAATKILQREYDRVVGFYDHRITPDHLVEDIEFMLKRRVA